MDRLTTRNEAGYAGLSDEAYEHNFTILESVLIDRLAVFEDAKEQGKMVDVPCRIDEQFFILADTLPRDKGRLPDIVDGTVCSIKLCDRGVFVKMRIFADWEYSYYSSNERDHSERYKYFVYPASAIGVTLLHTREEAEAALEKRNG